MLLKTVQGCGVRVWGFVPERPGGHLVAVVC